MDKFSGDLADEVAILRAEVAELKAIIRTRPALTTASQGWRLTDMTIPSVTSGEVRIGSSSSDFFVATTAGVKRAFLQAAAITNQANMLAGTPAPTDYDPSWATNLRADVAATRQYAFDLTSRLRTAGMVAS